MADPIMESSQMLNKMLFIVAFLKLYNKVNRFQRYLKSAASLFPLIYATSDVLLLVFSHYSIRFKLDRIVRYRPNIAVTYNIPIVPDIIVQLEEAPKSDQLGPRLSLHHFRDVIWRPDVRRVFVPGEQPFLLRLRDLQRAPLLRPERQPRRDLPEDGRNDEAVFGFENLLPRRPDL
jgi:hypothetical protein